jgi:hypothetical protein
MTGGDIEIKLGRDRARRWWVVGRRVGSIQRAAGFVGDVGFALLFPAPRVLLPSLWEAVAGEDVEPFGSGMGEPEQRVWTWKDELPRRGLAWYGRFLAGRASFLSPALLAVLCPGRGEPDDHAALPLSPAAHELARALAAEPLPSAVLRALVGDRARYERAVVELQRNLLVTTAGVQESRTGWPAAILDLTCRRFDVGGRLDHGTAASRFLDTLLETSPGDLARAFGWPVAETRARLDALEASGEATVAGRRYVLTQVPIRRA